MNSKNVRLGVTFLFLATSTFFVYAANAEDTAAPAPADSAASGDAGAPDGEADAEADADARPSYPAFDEKPFSDEKTPRPSKDDWNKAPQVELNEGSMKTGATCQYQRINEWMRIRCGTSTGKITLLCGNGEDVFLTLDRIREEWEVFPEGAEMVFAVRKGDRRLFEWQSIEFGYKGANSATSFLAISEMWLPGEEKPTIIAR